MNFIRILPLTYMPSDCDNIGEWCPFGDDEPLNKIVEEHNQKCYKSYQQINWPPQAIERLSCTILVCPCDLNHVDQLTEEDFSTIKILLIDSNAVDSEDKKLKWIRNQVSLADHEFYITNVNNFKTENVANFFDGTPVYLFPSESACNKSTFKSLLEKFCPPIRPIAAVSRDFPIIGIDQFIDMFSNVEDKIRHAAITQNLSTDERYERAARAIRTEANWAMLTEQLLTSGDISNINIDAIREPIIDIALKPYTNELYKPVDFVKIMLNKQTHNKVSKEKMHLIQTLGIDSEDHAAIHFDSTNTSAMVRMLGETVKISKFSTNMSGELPGSITARANDNLKF
jgi:hypothetical protein